MEQQTLSCCSLVAGGFYNLKDEKVHTVSHSLDFDGGNVVQFHLGVLSTYSYLLCSCDAAILIDPGRDINSYASYMDAHGIRLCGVFLTHLHTDFVSGHMEAGERFNVPVFISRDASADFRHIPLDDEVDFSLGRLKLHFFAAPGHAEDELCMSVGKEQEQPEILFTGDALDVPCTVNSGLDWLNKLEKLADETRLYPAHEFADSERSWRTWGEEKQVNPLFNPAVTVSGNVEKESVDFLRELNRKGPEIVDWNNMFIPVEPVQEMASDTNRVIDIRNVSAYARKHIPCSLNIEANGKLEQWTARLMEPSAGKITLVGDNVVSLTESAARLQAVGAKVDCCFFDQWEKAALPVSSSGIVDAQELDTWMWSEDPPLILDVRSEKEWNKSRLPGAINIPLPELEEKRSSLPRERAIVAVCASGYRSAIASGLLERGGFQKVFNLRGGLGAWLEEGKKLNTGKEKKTYTPEQSKCGIKS